MKLQHPLKTYIGFLIITFIFLFLIKQFNISYPLTIVTKPAPSNLSVVGEGKIDVVPDTSTIQAGIVVTNAPTVDDAQKQIDDVNNKIIDSLKKLGIPKQDIKTSNYSISPAYNYDGGRNQITGYNGNANVSITIKQQNILSQVTGAVTKAGANQVYGAQFSIEHPEKFREQAREKAIANAKEQAQKLAQSLGLKLGRVVNIVESNPDMPIVRPMPVMGGAGLGGSAKIAELEPGSQTVTSTVTLYFETK